jgi:hypothetical protein
VSIPRSSQSAWLVLANFVSAEGQANLARLRAACERADTRSFTEIDVVHLTGCSPAR